MSLPARIRNRVAAELAAELAFRRRVGMPLAPAMPAALQMCAIRLRRSRLRKASAEWTASRYSHAGLDSTAFHVRRKDRA